MQEMQEMRRSLRVTTDPHSRAEALGRTARTTLRDRSPVPLVTDSSPEAISVPVSSAASRQEALTDSQIPLAVSPVRIRARALTVRAADSSLSSRIRIRIPEARTLPERSSSPSL